MLIFKRGKSRDLELFHCVHAFIKAKKKPSLTLEKFYSITNSMRGEKDNTNTPPIFSTAVCMFYPFVTIEQNPISPFHSVVLTN